MKRDLVAGICYTIQESQRSSSALIKGPPDIQDFFLASTRNKEPEREEGRRVTNFPNIYPCFPSVLALVSSQGLFCRVADRGYPTSGLRVLGPEAKVGKAGGEPAWHQARPLWRHGLVS
jgi:hypothetical protein